MFKLRIPDAARFARTGFFRYSLRGASMSRKCLFLTLVIVLAVPNLAAIRRSEDPIRDTQTDGILYKQKMEEEKDGKKGALLYSVKYNPKDTFLTAPPFAPEAEKPAAREAMPGETAGLNWWDEPAVPADALAAPEEPVSPEQPAEGYWEQETAAGTEVLPGFDAAAEMTDAGGVSAGISPETAATNAAPSEDYWW
ncbi:MAG: hypothetical protein BWY49_00245 [Candidatus Omnitrophica bacterium ADurb.Bin314]|jgi:hypothetical protein|nr:MAG: hypothetical protein BWY49_00245 [Candidatus Omnitrophica bacterium ADurb.Bin314]